MGLVKRNKGDIQSDIQKTDKSDKMARNVRTHMGGDAPTDSDNRPKHLTKQEFGRRLYRLMTDKGWSQSELARRADVTRDAVSTYVRGASLPSPLNLSKLAKALDVEPEKLLPNQIEQSIDHDPPALELKVSATNPDVAWLRINRLVTTGSALQIMDILRNDNPVVSD